MVWLAINREWISLAELQANIVPRVPPRSLLEALESLQARSLIEKNAAQFTQQPVVMEYVTERLIEQIAQELESHALDWFDRYALIKAQAQDYLRNTQIRLILTPIADQLLARWGGRSQAEHGLGQSLSRLRSRPVQPPGYAAGNLLNLLWHLQIDLSGYDFSGLTVWQAYLQDMTLHQVNLAGAETGHCVRQIETHLNWALAIALSPDGQTLATASDGKTVKFWQVQTGDCIQTLPHYTSKVWAVAFSPDGQLLATASDNKTVKLWAIATGECLQTLREHTQQVWLVAFSPTGQTLVSASEDDTVRLWTVATGQCLRTLKAHSNWVLSVAVDGPGKRLISGHQDGQIRLWDWATGACLQTLPAHSSPVSAIVLLPPGTMRREGRRRGGSSLADRDPQGQLLASGSDDHTIKLWDLNHGEYLSTLWGHQGWVQSIAVSPDGHVLASGSHDHRVKLWDWRSGECLQTLEGHINRVKTVAFCPQGEILSSGGDDRTIKIWDVQTGVCLQTLEGHQDWVL